jgi:hypothetical protein
MVLVRKSFLIIVVLLVSLQCTYTQSLSNQVSIASPTAASLGKYADIPVFYHTGVPQINIPLYTVKEGPLQLPVSLSYHASGLKVMEYASWVGAGWSLNAGGVITRTVQGGPDDRGLNAARTTHGHFHDYGYNKYLFSSGGGTCGSPPCPTGASYPADDASFAQGIKDGEPDLYFYNFAGRTGKFYFHDDRTPVLVPQQDLKIEPILADESVNTAYIFMLGFIVTTPDGTKYYFGKNQLSDGNPDAWETTNTINTHTTTSTSHAEVSSWFLNQIVSADGQFSIKLIYQSEKSSQYTLSMFPVFNTYTSGGVLGSFGDYEYDLAKNFINGLRLSKIVFTNGTINFTPGAVRTDVGDYNSTVMADVANSEAKTLGTIEITNGVNACKKFKLFYGYFQDTVSPLNGFYKTSFPILANIASDKYRLRLDSVQELSCDNTISIPVHKFTYYTDRVPRKLTFGQDHWGYFNGVTTNESLVPSYTLNGGPIGGANRDPAWPAMRGGTLKRITYPTGGYSEFEYEAHDTYGSITTYDDSLRQTLNAGYTASTTTQTIYMTFSGNAYQVVLTNSNSGGVANLYIYNSSNTLIENIPANTGVTKTSDWFTLPYGTYRVELTKPDIVGSGNGATATITEYVPTTTQGNIMVGGLRVKKVTTNDNVTSNDMVTNYAYNIAGNTHSSGMLYSRPRYVSLVRNDLVKQIGGGQSPAFCSTNGCLNCDASTRQSYYVSGGSITPLATTQGNHIGYDEVKVSQTGNGYTIYRYYGSAIWSAVTEDIVIRKINNLSCDLNAPSFPATPVPFEFKRGELKYEGHFNESGQPLKEVDYYPDYELDSVTTPGYKPVFITLSGNSFLWGTEYELMTARKVKTQAITTETDPATNNYLTTTQTEYYGSRYHYAPTRSVKYTSSGDSIIIKTKYAFDFRVANCDSISNGWTQYAAAYSTAASTYSSSLSCTNGSWNCKWLAYQQFRYDKSVARSNYIAWRRTKFTDPTNLFATNHASAKSGAGIELKPILELHDKFTNTAIEVSTWKNGNLLSGVFNRFDFASAPASAVCLNKVQVINLATPSGTFAEATATTTSVTKDSRYKDQSAYKFYNGNLVEIKEKNGLYTSYIWGLNNTQPIVKAVGVDHSTLKTAYDAVSGNLSTLRSQSSLQGAQVFTYAFAPLIGMTSEIDAANRAIYYEYDSLQRLRLIRDKDSNIVKQFVYAYQSFAHSSAVWRETGVTRCKPCSTNVNYITNVLQKEERDINGESATYNQTRWVDAGASAACVVATWENTATAVRCKTINGANTGEKEQEQKDMNPCSGSYNQTRWIVIGTDSTTCPPPVIYAKLTYDNYTYLSNYTYSDVIISFFSDAACTVPVSVSGLSVNVREDTNTWSGSGSYTSSYSCSGYELVIISQAMRYYDDGFGGWETHDFVVVAGTGYTPVN